MQEIYTEPHWETSALLVIDMQERFVSPKIEKDGTKAHAILDAIIRLLNGYRENGKPIFHIVRSYLPDGTDADGYRRGIVEMGEFVLSPESDEAQIVQGLLPDEFSRLNFNLLKNGSLQQVGSNEWAMYKPRLGAFFKTPLENRLKEIGLDTLVVAGTFFPNCVRQTITEGNERDFRTVCVNNAVFGGHDLGMKELEAMGTACLTAEQVLQSAGI